MYPPVKISDALGNIAYNLLDNYGVLFDLDLEAEDPTHLRLMNNQVKRFIRKLQYTSQSFAAALQGADAFKHAMEQEQMMYHAHSFGQSDIISAFLPTISSNAPWFEIVMNAKMTPLQMFNGSTIYLNLNR